MEKPKVIRYKIARIKTSQFALFENAYKKDEDKFHVVVTTMFGKTDGHFVYTTIKLEFSFSEGPQAPPFAIIETSIFFDVYPDDMNAITDENGTKLPNNFAKNIASLTLSTIRGIFHEKCQDTFIGEKIMIPVMNISDFVSSEDVLIN